MNTPVDADVIQYNVGLNISIGYIIINNNGGEKIQYMLCCFGLRKEANIADTYRERETESERDRGADVCVWYQSTFTKILCLRDI